MDESESIKEHLRKLPSVSEFLSHSLGKELCHEFGAGIVKMVLRETLDTIRHRIRQGYRLDGFNIETLARQVQAELIRRTASSGRRLVNATGILLHTNLGRAPLCREAIEAIQAAAHYTPLEVDLQSGKRSHRGCHVERLLRELTGCEAAVVVNNNAAATALILNTMANARQIVISRGQLVEIGGSFRLPDVMDESGARLRAIGTTNRTYLSDYEAAINEETGALLYVHPSNYQIKGYAATPSVRELAQLAHAYNRPLIADIGSGALVPLEDLGFSNEPVVSQMLAEGADVVCFSGDKLVGGPQCGIICGSDARVTAMRQNPLTRMFRVDKLTLAALEATLTHFINGTFQEAIPLYEMMGRSTQRLREMAESITSALPDLKTMNVSIVEDQAFVGSGSIPEEALPTQAIRIEPKASNQTDLTVEELAGRLRCSTPSIFGRIQQGGLLLDMRTVQPGEEAAIVEELKAYLAHD